MRQLVTIEKGHYENLLAKERELDRVNKINGELNRKCTDLELRLFTLLTTKELAESIVNLGKRETKPLDSNI